MIDILVDIGPVWCVGIGMLAGTYIGFYIGYTSGSTIKVEDIQRLKDKLK